MRVRKTRNGERKVPMYYSPEVSGFDRIEEIPGGRDRFLYENRSESEFELLKNNSDSSNNSEFRFDPLFYEHNIVFCQMLVDC